MIFIKRTLILIVIVLCFNVCAIAQQLSLQLVGGLMNYGGDLQSQGYTFKQAHPTVGINALYQFNHFGVRAGFAYGKVSARDKLTTTYKKRNLNFHSDVVEGSLDIEYDFFSLEKDSKIVPYVFAGIGVYHYNPYTFYQKQKVYLQPLGTEGEGLAAYPDKKLYSLTGFEDPYGIGVRYKISSNLLLGVEYNSRLLFTDYLDDVSTVYPDKDELYKGRGQLAVDLSYRGKDTEFPSGSIRGNPRQNDNYYSSVITLTYIFPERSTFGNSSNRRHSSRSLSCPKVR